MGCGGKCGGGKKDSRSCECGCEGRSACASGPRHPLPGVVLGRDRSPSPKGIVGGVIAQAHALRGWQEGTSWFGSDAPALDPGKGPARPGSHGPASERDNERNDVGRVVCISSVNQQPRRGDNNGCAVYSLALANQKTYGVTDDETNQLIYRINRCLRRKGLRGDNDPNIDGVLPRDFPKLFACKSEVMERHFGIKGAEYVRGPGRRFGNPFVAGRCPKAGDVIVLHMTVPGGRRNAEAHAIMCEVVECDPKTGAAKLKCKNHARQGGGSFEISVDKDGIVDSTPDAYDGMQATAVIYAK